MELHCGELTLDEGVEQVGVKVLHRGRVQSEHPHRPLPAANQDFVTRLRLRTVVTTMLTHQTTNHWHWSVQSKVPQTVPQTEWQQSSPHLCSKLSYRQFYKD